MQHVRRTGFSLKTRWVLSNVVKSCNKLDSFLEYVPSRSLSDVGVGRFSSMAAESAAFSVSAKRVCEVLVFFEKGKNCNVVICFFSVIVAPGMELLGI